MGLSEITRTIKGRIIRIVRKKENLFEVSIAGIPEKFLMLKTDFIGNHFDSNIPMHYRPEIRAMFSNFKL